jgi:hypothetical protein
MYISKLLRALNGNSPKYHGIRQPYIRISYHVSYFVMEIKKVLLIKEKKLICYLKIFGLGYLNIRQISTECVPYK